MSSVSVQEKQCADIWDGRVRTSVNLFFFIFKSNKNTDTNGLDQLFQISRNEQKALKNPITIYSGKLLNLWFNSVQFISVAWSCPTICNPMDCIMPGLPVHYQLREFTQTRIHRVSDASNYLISVIPFCSRLQSFPASVSFPMSQFFTLGGHRLELQHQSFQ